MSDADRLRSGPTIGVDIGSLPLELRARVHKIEVCGTPGVSTSNASGRFTNVVYLEGDERAAAAKFAEVNADQLESIDFLSSNVVQTSVERPLYDLILDALGERSLTWGDGIVAEQRRDGTAWVFTDEAYVTRGGQRYRLEGRGGATARVDRQLDDVFAELTPTVTPSTLQDAGAEGNVSLLVAYYRQCEEYNNDAITE